MPKAKEPKLYALFHKPTQKYRRKQGNRGSTWGEIENATFSTRVISIGRIASRPYYGQKPYILRRGKKCSPEEFEIHVFPFPHIQEDIIPYKPARKR